MNSITLNITIPEEMLQKLIEQELTRLIRERTAQMLDNEVMNVDEAARYLKIAKQTLYTKSSRGEIPSFKSGGLKFRREDLDEWMSRGKRTTAQDIDTQAANYLMKNRIGKIH